MKITEVIRNIFRDKTDPRVKRIKELWTYGFLVPLKDTVDGKPYEGERGELYKVRISRKTK